MKKQTRQFVIKADVPNLNKRIYPKKILEQVVEKFQTNHVDLPLCGHIGMPKSGMIEFENVSHTIQKLYLEGDNLYVDIRTLDTPQGQVLEKMLENGEVAFRLSGKNVSSHENQNGNVVIDSYELVTINAVLVSEAS